MPSVEELEAAEAEAAAAERATRHDWPIPVAGRAECIARLGDILNPQGQLGRVATPGEVFYALRVLAAFAAQDAAQRRLDQRIEDEDVVDVEAQIDEMIAVAKQYYGDRFMTDIPDEPLDDPAVKHDAFPEDDEVGEDRG
jgi:hypothetical protein